MSRNADQSGGREIARVKAIFAFEVTGRGTVLAVEILRGLVRAGSALQNKGRFHTIASVQFVDGIDLPPGTVGLLPDEASADTSRRRNSAVGLLLGEAGIATHFVRGEQLAVIYPVSTWANAAAPSVDRAVGYRKATGDSR
jgi:hypothetical protein